MGTTQRKIRFAIVGCGRIAERHAEHISRLGELVSVCDIKQARADMFEEKFGAKAYYSIDDLLAGEDRPDVITICTPNGLHAEHSIKALNTGFHVLCEKPMALNVTDCEKMITASRQAGRELFIVKQNRYNPPVALVKKLIDEGRLGKIHSVQVNCFWNRGKAYYEESDWKGTKKLDGGVLFTQFSHFIDLLYWMLGDLSHIEARVENSAHPYVETEDHGMVVFRTEGGAIGTLNYTVNCFQKNMEGSIAIFGEKGTVKIGGQYINVIEHAIIDGFEVPPLPKGNAANDYGTYQGSMSNHDKVYESVISALNGGDANYATGDDGLKTVEIINRIYKAGQWA